MTNEFNKKRLQKGYEPPIGGNIPPTEEPPEPSGATDHYANIDDLRRDLEILFSQARSFEGFLEDKLLSFHLLVGDFDPGLVAAHRNEWPQQLGEPSFKISYRYYKAMRLRRTTSAAYIRKRYEEAARDVTGTPAIDMLVIVNLIKDEIFLIREFLNVHIGEVDDSSEQRIIELFQDWVQAAFVYLREFRNFIEEREEATELLPEHEVERFTPEEAKQGQAVFKVRLNGVNEELLRELELLKKFFSEFATTFYDKFLGPALEFRLNVSRRILPTGSTIAQQSEEASENIEANLRAAIADQMRRKTFFSKKLEQIANNFREQDKFRSYIIQLSEKGSPIKTSGALAMVDEDETSLEVTHWENVERIHVAAEEEGTPIPPEEEPIVIDSLVSDNYVPGVSGFSIAENGDVEFNGGIFRNQLFVNRINNNIWNGKSISLQDFEDIDLGIQEAIDNELGVKRYENWPTVLKSWWDGTSQENHALGGGTSSMFFQNTDTHSSSGGLTYSYGGHVSGPVFDLWLIEGSGPSGAFDLSGITEASSRIYTSVHSKHGQSPSNDWITDGYFIFFDESFNFIARSDRVFTSDHQLSFEQHQRNIDIPRNARWGFIVLEIYPFEGFWAGTNSITHYSDFVAYPLGSISSTHTWLTQRPRLIIDSHGTLRARDIAVTQGVGASSTIDRVRLTTAGEVRFHDGVVRMSSSLTAMSFHVAATTPLTINDTALFHNLPLRSLGGSATSPTYSFALNTNMGMYRAASNILGFAVAGTQVVALNHSTGMTLPLANGGGDITHGRDLNTGRDGHFGRHVNVGTDLTVDGVYNGKVARGRVARIQVTTGQNGITSVTDLTGLSVTFNTQSGRLYRVEGRCNFNGVATGNAAQLSVTNPANDVFDASGVLNLPSGVANAPKARVTYEFVGDGNSHTYKLRASATGTGANTVSSSGRVAVIEVFDDGPA